MDDRGSYTVFWNNGIRGRITLALNNEQAICLICLESYSSNEAGPVRLPCAAQYLICMACATRYFQPVPQANGSRPRNACPFCQQQHLNLEGQLAILGLQELEVEGIPRSVLMGWFLQVMDQGRRDVQTFPYRTPFHFSRPAQLGTSLVRERELQNLGHWEITEDEDAEAVLAMAQLMFYQHREAMRTMRGPEHPLPVVLHPAVPHACFRLMQLLHWHGAGRLQPNCLLGFERTAWSYLREDLLIAPRLSYLPAGWFHMVEALIQRIVHRIVSMRRRRRNVIRHPM